MPVSAVSVPCQICGIEGHSPQDCPYFIASETQVAEVNYTQNQGPFSQSYNPSWKNHPNLSCKNANRQNFAPANLQGYRPQGNAQYQQQQILNRVFHQVVSLRLVK